MARRQRLRDALKTSEMPGKKLNDEQRIRIYSMRTNGGKSYVEISEALKVNRQPHLTYEQVAELEGIQACRPTLIDAFEKELHHRRVAIEKPLLSDTQKDACLSWAQPHINWTDAQWIHVIWTDEASVSTGFCGKIYVTRRAEEKYQEA
ncbi:hypothetical protein K3495_g12771 [Podosphaera aphanis]|nr:hypothetical protein K3495_g12771 [Podosphaera aphanis]